MAVLFGCAAAAVLAMAVDQLLGLLEAAAARRDRRRAVLGAGGLAILAILSLAPFAVRALAGRSDTYVVGAKNFSEQFILSDLMADRLRSVGARVEQRTGLGSAVIFRALVAGDLDAYVDYSGTLWTTVLGRTDTPPRAQLLTQLKSELKRRYGVEMLGSLGFENAYALTLRTDRASALGLHTLDDLTAQAPSLVLGADLEFLQRPEWRAFRDAYRLRFKAAHAYTPTFMYRALNDGEADVITAFSSDGRLAGEQLTALTDLRGAAPGYDAVVLVSHRRARDERLAGALRPLGGAISPGRMRAANAQVDLGGRTPEQAAAEIARAISPAGSPARGAR